MQDFDHDSESKQNPTAIRQWGSGNLQFAPRTRLPRCSAAAHSTAAGSNCVPRIDANNLQPARQTDSGVSWCFHLPRLPPFDKCGADMALKRKFTGGVLTVLGFMLDEQFTRKRT